MDDLGSREIAIYMDAISFDPINTDDEIFCGLKVISPLPGLPFDDAGGESTEYPPSESLLLLRSRYYGIVLIAVHNLLRTR